MCNNYAIDKIKRGCLKRGGLFFNVSILSVFVNNYLNMNMYITIVMFIFNT